MVSGRAMEPPIAAVKTWTVNPVALTSCRAGYGLEIIGERNTNATTSFASSFFRFRLVSPIHQAFSA